MGFVDILHEENDQNVSRKQGRGSNDASTTLDALSLWGVQNLRYAAGSWLQLFEPLVRRLSPRPGVQEPDGNSSDEHAISKELHILFEHTYVELIWNECLTLYSIVWTLEHRSEFGEPSKNLYERQIIRFLFGYFVMIIGYNRNKENSKNVWVIGSPSWQSNL